MFTREEMVEAAALKKRGWSVSAVARHLGRDRKTVRAHLRGDTTPGARRRSEDPFARLEPYVRQRLTDDPHLRLTVLMRELRDLGSASSYQTLTREVRARSLRPRCEACEGATGRATVEIEHPPGAETQWDWLELPDAPWGGKGIVLVGALAHSSKLRGAFSPAKDAPHLIAGADRVLRGLGGLTKSFRIDAMEGAVVPGTRRLGAEFADFCRSLGVGVDICPPRRGNRKGVVEKANDYLAQSWWRTADVATPEEAQSSLDRFCERVADVRLRGDASVGELAGREPLRPLPARPYPAVVREDRGVSWGALVSFDGNRYSVPPAFAGTQAVVVWSPGEPEIEIRSVSGELLARHRRRPAGAGATERLPEHKAELEKTVLQAFTTDRPCRRKANRPPSETARALARELRGEGEPASPAVDLRLYEEMMRP